MEGDPAYELTESKISEMFYYGVDLESVTDDLVGLKRAEKDFLELWRSGILDSLPFSMNGQYIRSRHNDRTIQIWNDDGGSKAGKPLEGHTRAVCCISYSPDGRYIISGSADRTIRIWDAIYGDAVGEPLMGHGSCVMSVAYSPDGQRIISGSKDGTIRIWDPKTASTPFSSRNPIHAAFYTRPDSDGWVRDSADGLLYWVPPDCRVGLHSTALMTIPETSHVRSVSLDFDDFAFGTSWTLIFNSAQP